MKQTIEASKKLGEKPRLSAVRSEKNLLSTNRVLKHDREPTSSYFKSVNPERQIFQKLANNQYFAGVSKNPTLKDANVTDLIFKIAQAKNPIDLEKAKLKMQKKQKVVMMAQKMETEKEGPTGVVVKKERGLKRAISLKDLTLMENKDEARKLQVFLKPHTLLKKQQLEDLK